MKNVLLLFVFSFTFFSLSVSGQTLSNQEIKSFIEEGAKTMDLPYEMPGTGVIMQSITTFGRNIIFTYQVPEDWYLLESAKEELIKTLSEKQKNLYFNEQINLIYNYTRNNSLVDKVYISYDNFGTRIELNQLGEYISYKNHPKAKGVNIKIKDPLAFEKQEGDRPNIVAKFNNKVIHKPVKIISVRGPKTRKKLIKMGIDCPECFGDPLILFRLICNPMNSSSPKVKVGIIPHYIDKGCENLQKLKHQLANSSISFKLIDIILPSHDYQGFIDEIISCEYIISSSLHGIIMGIIYQKKTILVEFGSNVVGRLFKFQDFFESINISYEVKNLANDHTRDQDSLLENVISVDYDQIVKTGTRMIQIAPFFLNKEQYITQFSKIYLQK